jgi:hypothetical protein
MQWQHGHQLWQGKVLVDHVACRGHGTGSKYGTAEPVQTGAAGVRITARASAQSSTDRWLCCIRNCGSLSAPIRNLRGAHHFRIVTRTGQEFPGSEDLFRLVWSRTDDQVNDCGMGLVVKPLVLWRRCPGDVDPDVNVGHEVSRPGTHVDGIVGLVASRL